MHELENTRFKKISTSSGDWLIYENGDVESYNIFNFYYSIHLFWPPKEQPIVLSGKYVEFPHSDYLVYDNNKFSYFKLIKNPDTFNYLSPMYYELVWECDNKDLIKFYIKLIDSGLTIDSVVLEEFLNMAKKLKA